MTESEKLEILRKAGISVHFGANTIQVGGTFGWAAPDGNITRPRNIDDGVRAYMEKYRHLMDQAERQLRALEEVKDDSRV